MTRTVQLVGLACALVIAAAETQGCGSSNKAGIKTQAGTGGSAGSTTGSAGASTTGSAGASMTSGAGASVSGGGGTFQTGIGGCPIYQAPCGGKCVTITNDGQNCGGCNIKCPANRVCSGGACSVACLPGSGLSPCSGQCVDKNTDNNNCGTCGNVCSGANTACLGGSCGPAKVFAAPAGGCMNGGAPVQIGAAGSSMCAGLLAQTTFTWSVCSCKNVLFDDDAYIDGWDSTRGPYVAHQLGGGLGADGSISSQSLADIWGQSWAASTATSFNVAAFNVHHDLQSGGNITCDMMDVTRDAYVAGNINGQMTVGGTLYQTPGKAHGGLKAVAQAVTVKPPCDCTKPVPVVDLVAWGKTNNDDAAIGLDPGIMSQAGHPARIDLPCGRYYMTGFSSGGTIVAHGNTVLFVDGSVTSSGNLEITVADSSSALDLFVSGTIVATSSFTLGNPNYPALTRLYIGSSQSLDVQSALIVGAEIWAGNAKVLWESDSDVFGALFAGDLEVLSKLNLHHDQGVTVAGHGCEPPGGTTGGGGASGGGGTGGGGMCNSCKDCGNQACVNGACGACTTSADCCSPLVCDKGQCVYIVP
jgi:hypothetical protein